MPFLIGLLVALVGGFALARALRREKLTYPHPETLIIQPESDVPLEQRILKLEGGVNFRDVGGYRTRSGQRIRTGLVYRSGTLSRLTPAGWEQVAALHIQAVCDLRSDDELKEDPATLPAGLAYTHLPLNTESQTFSRLRGLLFERRNMDVLMVRTYVDLMVERNPQVFGAALAQLADPANLPAIIHCTAGKDRTGVTIILLLMLLDVPQEIIMADYTLSNYDYAFFNEVAEVALRPFARLGITTADLQPLLSADSRTAVAVIEHIKSRYGSAERYLMERAGLDTETLARIKANLLEGA
ncbi:MAG: tyrosine-protein phosphatase [Anaerolineae bacterium]